MAYFKQTWANGEGGGTPVSASRLNHIEDGIKGLSDNALRPTDLTTAIATAHSYTDAQVGVETAARIAAIAGLDLGGGGGGGASDFVIGLGLLDVDAVDGTATDVRILAASPGEAATVDNPENFSIVFPADIATFAGLLGSIPSEVRKIVLIPRTGMAYDLTGIDIASDPWPVINATHGAVFSLEDGSLAWTGVSVGGKWYTTFPDPDLEARASAATNATDITTVAASVEKIHYVSAREFGATGLGVSDDRAAIQAALDSLPAGGGTVRIPAGNYLLYGPLIVPSNTQLVGDGKGCTKLFKATSVKTALTANVSQNALTCTVASTTGLAVGQAISIQDDYHTGWLSTQGYITNITGTTVTWVGIQPGRDIGAMASYTATDNGFLSTSHSLITSRFGGYSAGAVNVTIRDMTLDQVQSSNDPLVVLPYSGYDYANFVIAAIHFESARFCLVENVQILNAAGDAYSDQGRNNYVGENHNVFNGNTIKGASRHGVHTGSNCVGATITNNVITDCGLYGHFYCADSTYGIDQGNTVMRCLEAFGGIDSRDIGNVIDSNVIKDCKIGVEAVVGGSDDFQSLIISSNTMVVGSTDTDMAGTGIRTAMRGTVISGNKIQCIGDGGYGIRVDSGGHNTVANGNTIVMKNYADGASIQSADVMFTGNTFVNCQTAVNLYGADRFRASGNALGGATKGFFIAGDDSEDVVIDDRTYSATSPGSYTPYLINSPTLAPRLVYNRLGENGSNDPASAGDWNSITENQWNGSTVHWKSGGTDKLSMRVSGAWVTIV